MATQAIQEFPFQKYQQEKLFQDDGDAKVLLMRHERKGKEYVVKVIEATKISSYREGLSYEAYMGMKVLEDKRFAKTYKYYVTASLHYLVIEYFEGMELRKFVDQCKEKKIHADQLKILMRSYFKATSYLVKEGIYPKGLHDRNILIGKDLRVKIIDFEVYMFKESVDPLDMGHLVVNQIRPLFTLKKVTGADFKEFQELVEDYNKTDGWDELGDWVQKVLKHPFLQIAKEIG